MARADGTAIILSEDRDSRAEAWSKGTNILHGRVGESLGTLHDWLFAIERGSSGSIRLNLLSLPMKNGSTAVFTNRTLCITRVDGRCGTSPDPTMRVTTYTGMRKARIDEGPRLNQGRLRYFITGNGDTRFLCASTRRFIRCDLFTLVARWRHAACKSQDCGGVEQGNPSGRLFGLERALFR